MTRKPESREPQRARDRRPWRHLAAAAQIVISALVVLEIALRVGSLLPAETPTFRHDPETGFRMQAGIRVRGRHTSSRGYNDEEPRPKIDEGGGRPHLAVIGDSFVFGTVPRPENFTHVLERRLRERADEREVFNLGLPAAGPENYLGILRRDAGGPDAVSQEIGTVGVVFFVGNDVFQSHPDFRTRVFFGTPRAVLRTPFLVRLSADYFYSWKLLRGTVRLTRHQLESATDDAFSASTHLAIERRRLEICRRREDPHLEAAWRGAVGWLEAMASLAAERGQEFFVVLAPDQFQVDADLRQRVAERYDLDLAAYDLEKPQRRLGAALAERGIAVLDLLPDFARHGAEETLYKPRDTHWNRRGNELAAECLLRFLDSELE